MKKQHGVAVAALVAGAGVAGAFWSVRQYTVGSERECGRVGVAESPEPELPPGMTPGGMPDGEEGQTFTMDVPAGADMPEGMRRMFTMGGESELNPAELSFPDIDTPADVRAMLDELRAALPSKAPAASGYRSAGALLGSSGSPSRSLSSLSRTC